MHLHIPSSRLCGTELTPSTQHEVMIRYHVGGRKGQSISDAAFIDLCQQAVNAPPEFRLHPAELEKQGCGLGGEGALA